MKPIRSNELEFFKELIKDKFYDKQEQIQSEIHFEADKLSEKKQSTSAQECGFDFFFSESLSDSKCISAWIWLCLS